MSDLIGKYVISPLDGKNYCRKNGEFLKHLRLCGYPSYTSFFETWYPEKIEYCICGNKRKFNEHKMKYKQTCGNKKCANIIASTKKQSRTQEEWNEWKLKYKLAMSRKSDEEKRQTVERRTMTGKMNNSYMDSVKKRERTCKKRYGNKKYNNSTKISTTKLNWTEDKKRLFLKRLKEALGGKRLIDFHTEETYVERRKKLEEQGKIIPLSSLTEWQKYKKRVRNLTERTYRKYKNRINPTDLKRGIARRGTETYHLDHIVPIFYGFVHNIPESMIASVENLQMLSWHDNISKGKKHDSSACTKHEELENKN